MNPTSTPTKAAARSSHHSHQSGFLPLKKPSGSLMRSFRVDVRSMAPPSPPALPTETYGGSSTPIRLRNAFGECRMHIPRTRPMMNPPMWEKLSRPGKRPRANAMATSSKMKRRSLIGDRRSLHVYKRSSRTRAIMPNRLPEAPLQRP